MEKCRVCKGKVPEFQTFCSRCGARVYVWSTSSKQSFMAKLIGHLRSVLRTEEQKEADKHLQASNRLAQLVPPFAVAEALIPEHEAAARLDPNNSSILAISQAAAGLERARNAAAKLTPVGWGGYLKSVADSTTKSIISAVREVMKQESFESYRELDKAFGGALEMFDESLETAPSIPSTYLRRADAFRGMADDILMAYKVYPKHIVDLWSKEPIPGVKREKMGEMIEYERTQLGFAYPQLFSGFDFCKEVVWLYERAEEDYRQAIGFDSTFVHCYVEMSDLLSLLGKSGESSSNLDKALSVLNKAIQADVTDVDSYLERAEVYERLGQTKLAIADLEHALTLDTRTWKIRPAKNFLKQLRERESGV